MYIILNKYSCDKKRKEKKTSPTILQEIIVEERFVLPNDWK